MDSRNLKIAARRAVLACVVPGCVVSTTIANAVEPELFEVGDAGAIAPHVQLDFGFDSNPLRADEGSEGSLYLRFQPSVEYLLRRRNNRLTFGYSGDYYQYFQEFCQFQDGVDRPGDCVSGSPSFDSASYFDQRLSLDGFLEVTNRVRATLGLSHEIQHQPLGTGLSANAGVLGALTTPDEWNITTARAEVSYGAFQARGELRAGITLSDRELETELEEVNLDARSETSVAPFVSLLYRIGTRTQLFGTIGASQIRDGVSFNPDGTPDENLERDRTRLAFGVELDDSAVTSGRFSVSAVNEDFLVGDRDLDFFAFDASLTWRPRRFSTVTISGGRETFSGVFDDDLAIRTTLDARWVHFWRERVSSTVEVGFINDEDVDEFFSATETDIDEDNIWSFRFQGNYNIRRFLDIGAFVLFDTRDGTGNTRDFERTQIGITANGTI